MGSPATPTNGLRQALEKALASGRVKSQTDLARKAKVGESQLSRYMNYHPPQNNNVKRRIARALGVKTDDIWRS